MSPKFEFLIAANHPALAGHFPGRPTVPGVVILDRVLGGMSPAADRLRATLEHVTFSAPLWPGETAHVAVATDTGRSSFEVSTQRGGAAVSIATGRVRFGNPQDGEHRAEGAIGSP